MSLIEKIAAAQSNKPKFGAACNHCGWCCMTEVCTVGKANGAGEMIPCKFLFEAGGDYFCDLAKTEKDKKKIGIGTGCDAMTQNEMIRINNL